MLTPAIHLLSLWRDPPEWVLWARPTTEAEREQLGSVSLVLTLDVGEDEASRTDYGVADLGVHVRWLDEPAPPDVASYALRRDVTEMRGTPWMAWLKDVRRDLRRRHERHRQTYTRGKIHVLDPRRETHARRQ